MPRDCHQAITRVNGCLLGGTDGLMLLRMLCETHRDASSFLLFLYIALGSQTQTATALLLSNAMPNAVPCMDLLSQAGMIKDRKMCAPLLRPDI